MFVDLSDVPHGRVDVVTCRPVAEETGRPSYRLHRRHGSASG